MNMQSMLRWLAVAIAAPAVFLLVPRIETAAQPGLPAGFPAPAPPAPGAFANQDAQAPARGGAANADFDSLIELITSTTAPDTWAENGGGEAEIRPFPTGVWIDPTGVIASLERNRKTDYGEAKSPESRPPSDPAVSDPRRESELRYVSLPRLEAEIDRRSIAGEPLDEAMLTLAGLRRVERVVAVPPTQNAPGDLLLAGPAGDWRVNEDSRLVASDSGRAVVRLDDLLVLLRREAARPGEPLGCAITPRQEALAATQAKLDETSQAPLKPGQRKSWLEGVRSTLGRQDIEVFGLDPATNAARVLVEADHHMKRLGLGDADSDLDFPNYLDRAAARVRAGQAAQPLAVLRWWFAPMYEPIEAGSGWFGLSGQGVQVLSENELLTRRGERIHTMQADPLTEGFARDFTENFDRLCAEFPVYSELRNVFDLAMVAALVHEHELIEAAGWSPTLALDPRRLPTPRLRHPTEVETIAVSCVVKRRHILAAVSGGAWIEPLRIESREVSERSDPPATPRNGGVWWWDATSD